MIHLESSIYKCLNQNTFYYTNFWICGWKKHKIVQINCNCFELSFYLYSSYLCIIWWFQSVLHLNTYLLSPCVEKQYTFTFFSVRINFVDFEYCLPVKPALEMAAILSILAASPGRKIDKTPQTAAPNDEIQATIANPRQAFTYSEKWFFLV